MAHRILIPAFGPLSIREMYPGMLDIAEQLIQKVCRESFSMSPKLILVTCLQWYRFGDAKIDAVSDFTKLTLDSKSNPEHNVSRLLTRLFLRLRSYRALHLLLPIQLVRDLRSRQRLGLGLQCQIPCTGSTPRILRPSSKAWPEA